MITKLLALEVKNSPNINSEYTDALELFEVHKECETEEDLLVLSTITRKPYECLTTSKLMINLRTFETQLSTAKHAVSAVAEIEDFV